jgi:hypothetical protein
MARAAPRLRTLDGKLNGLGLRVSTRRSELKLTQDELCARLATVSHGEWNAGRMEIYRIEAGLRIVSDLELIVLAEALESSPLWLLLGDR